MQVIDQSNITSLSKSYQDDIVEEVYKIHLNENIFELSNDFCKYYHATNIETNEEVFAIIFDRSFCYSSSTLQALKGANVKGLNNLLTYSLVRISALKAYHLIAIVEKYNYSYTLANYIEKNGPLSADQITRSLIPTLINVLAFCEKNNIPAGNINASNIVVTSNNEFILKTFITTYPHFHQNSNFLAPEIAECLEAGRYIPSVCADIYALGIVVFYALTGKQPWTDYENTYQYNSERFEQTTFKLLVNKRRISDQFKIFFKWTLQDNAGIRWKLRNIFEWISGGHFKAPSFEKAIDSASLLSFNGHNFGNLRSISYALSLNWDEAIKFINDDKLVKWAQRHHLNSNMSEDIQQILKNEQSSKSVGNVSSDGSRKLTKLLSVIDAFGPMRFKTIAFSTYSVPNLLYHLVIQNKKGFAEFIVKSLVDQLWRISDNQNSGSDLDATTSYRYTEIAKLYSSNTSSAYGLERITYMLNPHIPCLSPILSEDYVTNISELLSSLDKIAGQNPEKFNLDRQIIAFTAAKIDIRQEVNLKILKNFPKFSDNPLIYGLSILSIAQQYEPSLKIPNLCKVLTNKIIELFDEFLHNTKFKDQLKEKLTELAKTGSLAKIVELLYDQNPFINDYNGFYSANMEIQKLKHQIAALTYNEKIFDSSLVLGQKLTVLFSYILCLVVTVILVI